MRWTIVAFLYTSEKKLYCIVVHTTHIIMSCYWVKHLQCVRWAEPCRFIRCEYWIYIDSFGDRLERLPKINASQRYCIWNAIEYLYIYIYNACGDPGPTIVKYLSYRVRSHCKEFPHVVVAITNGRSTDTPILRPHEFQFDHIPILRIESYKNNIWYGRYF